MFLSFHSVVALARLFLCRVGRGFCLNHFQNNLYTSGVDILCTVACCCSYRLFHIHDSGRCRLKDCSRCSVQVRHWLETIVQGCAYFVVAATFVVQADFPCISERLCCDKRAVRRNGNTQARYTPAGVVVQTGYRLLLPCQCRSDVASPLGCSTCFR